MKKKIFNSTKFYNNLFDKLFPIYRTLINKGYEKSLKELSNYINFRIIKIRSGKKVLDWIVPKEWELNEAYVKNSKNKKIIDFRKNNLSVTSYSQPVDKILDLKDLKKKLYSLPNLPNAIPYRTTYYKKDWSFNISHNEKKKLKKGKYHVVIKSKFKKGNLILGEKILKGSSDKYFLLSSYLCHPSLANNELGGPLALLGLFNKIREYKNRRLNYIFLINPETIGSIAYLDKNKQFFLQNKLIGGLVLTCIGGPEKKLTFKKTKNEKTNINDFFINQNNHKRCNIIDFSPLSGSDERQYCSAGFNLPVGLIFKNGYREYKEYHNSLDNKKFFQIERLPRTVDNIFSFIKNFDLVSGCLVLKTPYGENHLQKYDLYLDKHKSKLTKNILILLSYSDGKTSIIEIANKFNIDSFEIVNAVEVILKYKIARLKYY
jgi:aminopeptidase-like protein